GVGEGARRVERRRPRRAARTQSLAAHRARLGPRRLWPRAHVPDRRAHGGRRRAAGADAAARAARDAGDDLAKRRRLGAARGRGGGRSTRRLAPSPMKVTATERVELDAGVDFCTTGDTEKLVYVASGRVGDARSRLEPVATVVDGGEPMEMRAISED